MSVTIETIIARTKGQTFNVIVPHKNHDTMITNLPGEEVFARYFDDLNFYNLCLLKHYAPNTVPLFATKESEMQKKASDYLIGLLEIAIVPPTKDDECTTPLSLVTQCYQVLLEFDNNECVEIPMKSLDDILQYFGKYLPNSTRSDLQAFTVEQPLLLTAFNSLRSKQTPEANDDRLYYQPHTLRQ